MQDNEKPKPPKHLRAATKRWWVSVVDSFEGLEQHHYKLLQMACESLETVQAAREAIKEHGLIFVDRFGQPRARPEVGIARDAQIGFARALRELDLEVDIAPARPDLADEKRRYGQHG